MATPRVLHCNTLCYSEFRVIASVALNNLFDRSQHMRKSLIAQSVAAVVAGFCVVGTAHAIGALDVGAPHPVRPGGTANPAAALPPAAQLVVNTDGIGHINLVPYYSVQDGTDTYFNIINTDTVNGKAVKVRFRSAANSDDVFDFTVLMSPGDVFAAAVTTGDDGLPQVRTQDTTCTLPAVVNNRSFVLTRLDPKLSDEAKAVQASEGYIEIFTMADIPPRVAYSATDEDTLDLFNSIKHVNGVPRDCGSPAVVENLFNDPADAGEANDIGLFRQTTGLATNWTVINVGRATAHSGAATAVEGRTLATAPDEPGVQGYANITFFPQQSGEVDATQVNNFTSDPIFVGGIRRNAAGTGFDAVAVPPVKALFFDFPDLSTPLSPGALPTEQANGLSGALAVTSVSNEYTTEASIDASTDWVFSLPTRRYATAMVYTAPATPVVPNYQIFATVDFPATAASLPSSLFFTNTNTVVRNSQICLLGLQIGVGGAAVVADREERTATSDNDFEISPGTPGPVRALCGEVSILTFNGKPSLLGAEVAVTDLDTQTFENGWARIGTPGLDQNPDPAVVVPGGLPVIGYAAMEIINGDVDGVSANYGQTFPHRATRP
jgi:hypothetical protein